MQFSAIIKYEALGKISMAFLGGVGLYFLFPQIGPGFASVLFLLMAGFLFFYRNTFFIIGVLLCLGLLLGVWRAALVDKPSEFLSWYQTEQEFTAEVIKEIDERSDRQVLTVRPVGYTQSLLITLPLGTRYSYGDTLWISGKITEPKVYDDFNYKQYLRSQNITAQSYRPKAYIVASGGGLFISRWLLGIKGWYMERVKNVLPSADSGLLLGVVVGAKQSISEDVKSYLSITGLSHIVVASGFNVTVLVVVFQALNGYIGRKRMFWVTALAIICFAILTGLSASIVRASVMGLLFVFAQFNGRLYRGGFALCLAASCMVAINPFLLLWDVGFQLSFLATFALLFITPILQGLHVGSRLPQFIMNPLITSVAVSITTLPLLLLQFGSVSIISPISNVLIVPLVPLLMFFGVLIMFPIIGNGAAWVVGGLLYYMQFIVEFLARLPFAELKTRFGIEQFLASYVVIGGLLWFMYQYALERGESGTQP